MESFCGKKVLQFAAKQCCILRQNGSHFAAKYDAICGKTRCNLRQNAVHYVAKCGALLHKLS